MIGLGCLLHHSQLHSLCRGGLGLEQGSFLHYLVHYFQLLPSIHTYVHRWAKPYIGGLGLAGFSAVHEARDSFLHYLVHYLQLLPSIHVHRWAGFSVHRWAGFSAVHEAKDSFL